MNENITAFTIVVVVSTVAFAMKDIFRQVKSLVSSSYSSERTKEMRQNAIKTDIKEY